MRFILLIAKVVGLSVSPLFAEESETIKDTSSLKKVDSVKFVSYNLRNYLKMNRRINGKKAQNAPKPDVEINALLTYLNQIDPDILAVSEIGNYSDALDLQKRLKNSEMELPHLQWLQGGNSQRCLAIYSKFPIIENHSSADLEYEIGESILNIQRGILDVVIQINPDYQLRVIGLHLKSKRPVSQADQAEMRRNEAHLARQRIKEILATNPETNLLVHGDLNDTKNEPPIRALKGRWNAKDHMKDIRLRDEFGTTWTYYWDHADQYSRFDFVLASRSLVPEIDTDNSYLFFDPDWYSASDHRPLVINIIPSNKTVTK